jgi:hypothetical protein
MNFVLKCTLSLEDLKGQQGFLWFYIINEATKVKEKVAEYLEKYPELADVQNAVSVKSSYF